MSDTNPILWAYNLQCGKPGSAARLASDLRETFAEAATLSRPGMSEGNISRIRLDFKNAISQIAKAFKEHDSSFFRRLADGLDQLPNNNNPEKNHSPISCLFAAYSHCCLDSPTTGKVIEVAKRIWALRRVTGNLDIDPGHVGDTTFERKVAREIRQLPAQRWTDHLRELGLDDLPTSKPGPKPKTANNSLIETG